MPSRTEGIRRTVLFVSVSGWLGGPGASLATLLANLPDWIDPVLAAPEGGDLLAEVRNEVHLTEYVPLPRRRGQVPDLRSRSQAAAMLAAWTLRHRRRLACIHANGFTELHLAAPGAILAGVPVAVWFHGHDVGVWDRYLGPVWGRLLLDRRLAAGSPISRQVAVDAHFASEGEIEIIPEPIDPGACRAQDVADEGRRRVDPDSVFVGFLGGGARADKGFQIVPAIVRAAPDAGIQWLMFSSRPTEALGSEGSIWNELDQVGGDRVVAAGRVPDVRDAYARCDIVLCPSLRESFSRIVVEAMANGLPVVASDIPAHRALLGNGRAGALFPLEHPELAGEAVARLAGDPELRRQMGQAGMALSRTFEPESVVPRLAALYVDRRAQPKPTSSRRSLRDRWSTGAGERFWTRCHHAAPAAEPAASRVGP